MVIISEKTAYNSCLDYDRFPPCFNTKQKYNLDQFYNWFFLYYLKSAGE
jgi:hypothetical protein